MVLLLPQYSAIDGIVGNGRYNTDREARGRTGESSSLTCCLCWCGTYGGFGWGTRRVLPGGEVWEVTKMALLVQLSKVTFHYISTAIL